MMYLYSPQIWPNTPYVTHIWVILLGGRFEKSSCLRRFKGFHGISRDFKGSHRPRLTTPASWGAFFYYTADGKYMMKTVTQKEFVLLRQILKGSAAQISGFFDGHLMPFLAPFLMVLFSTHWGTTTTSKTIPRHWWFGFWASIACAFKSESLVSGQWQAGSPWVFMMCPRFFGYENANMFVGAQSHNFQTQIFSLLFHVESEMGCSLAGHWSKRISILL